VPSDAISDPVADPAYPTDPTDPVCPTDAGSAADRAVRHGTTGRSAASGSAPYLRIAAAASAGAFAHDRAGTA
jgi:hypothetical protein